MTTVSLAEATDSELVEYVTTWLREHLPDGWVDAVDEGDNFKVDTLKPTRDAKAFDTALGEAGLNTPTWPREYFGLDLSPEQGDIVDRVLRRYQVPRSRDFVGKTLGGATILQWGTEE